MLSNVLNCANIADAQCALYALLIVDKPSHGTRQQRVTLWSVRTPNARVESRAAKLIVVDAERRTIAAEAIGYVLLLDNARIAKVAKMPKFPEFAHNEIFCVVLSFDRSLNSYYLSTCLGTDNRRISILYSIIGYRCSFAFFLVDYHISCYLAHRISNSTQRESGVFRRSLTATRPRCFLPLICPWKEEKVAWHITCLAAEYFTVLTRCSLYVA